MKHIFVKTLIMFVTAHTVRAKRSLQNYTVNNPTQNGFRNYTVHNHKEQDVENDTIITRIPYEAPDPTMQFKITTYKPSYGLKNFTSHLHNEEGDEITTTSPTEIEDVCLYNYHDESSIERCILRSAKKAKQLFRFGEPSLGIQPLEPLNIPSIRLRQYNVPKENFRYDAWLSDVKLTGLTNFLFNKLEVYPKQMKISCNISLPLLVMEGDYVVLGEFQLLPVESTGYLYCNLSQCSASLEARGDDRIQKRTMVIDAVNVKFQCLGKPYASVIEIHSTSSEREKITTHIVKQHIDELAREAQPAVEAALAMVLEDVANKFLNEMKIIFNN